MSESTASASEPTLTERDMLGAMELLSTVSAEPDVLLVLTDEEIMALDGRSALELLGSPYLSQDAVDSEASAAAALRSLVARRMVVVGPEDRENEGAVVTGSADPAHRPGQLDRRLAGVITLRRIPEAMVTTARTLDGGSTTLAHYFFPEAGVLEEYITVDGFHHFAIPDLSVVPARIHRFVDPFEAADQDGPPESVAPQDAGETFDAADTRALSVLTAVADGAGRQATFFATSDRMRVLDNGPLREEPAATDTVQISDASPETLRTVISVMIPQPDAAPGS